MCCTVCVCNSSTCAVLCVYVVIVHVLYCVCSSSSTCAVLCVYVVIVHVLYCVCT